MSANTNYPYECYELSKKDQEDIAKNFNGIMKLIRMGPKGYCLPEYFPAQASGIYNAPLNKDDVFVVTFPRSGTTWTQELVWLIVNDLDYEKAASEILTKRYTFIEYGIFFPPAVVKIIKSFHSNKEDLAAIDHFTRPGVDILADIEGRRFIKSHLPLSLLPRTALDVGKMVYVARDPRDVAVSFYHLNKSTKEFGFIGDFKAYWDLFRRDLVCWAPMFEHLKEAWEQRNHPNMLFLYFEELKKDMPAVLRRVSTFFGKEYTDEQLAKLQDHLKIENFKNNHSVNFDPMVELNKRDPTAEKTFVRSGKSGGWREYFDEEMTRQAEQWMEDNLRGTDFRFPHITGKYN